MQLKIRIPVATMLLTILLVPSLLSAQTIKKKGAKSLNGTGKKAGVKQNLGTKNTDLKKTEASSVAEADYLKAFEFVKRYSSMPHTGADVSTSPILEELTNIAKQNNFSTKNVLIPYKRVISYSDAKVENTAGTFDLLPLGGYNLKPQPNGVDFNAQVVNANISTDVKAKIATILLRRQDLAAPLSAENYNLLMNLQQKGAAAIIASFEGQPTGLSIPFVSPIVDASNFKIPIFNISYQGASTLTKFAMQGTEVRLKATFKNARDQLQCSAFTYGRGKPSTIYISAQFTGLIGGANTMGGALAAIRKVLSNPDTYLPKDANIVIVLLDGLEESQFKPADIYAQCASDQDFNERILPLCWVHLGNNFLSNDFEKATRRSDIEKEGLGPRLLSFEPFSAVVNTAYKSLGLVATMPDKDNSPFLRPLVDFNLRSFCIIEQPLPFTNSTADATILNSSPEAFLSQMTNLSNLLREAVVSKSTFNGK